MGKTLRGLGDVGCDEGMIDDNNDDAYDDGINDKGFRSLYYYFFFFFSVCISRSMYV